MRPCRVVPPVGYRPAAGPLFRALVERWRPGDEASQRVLGDLRSRLGAGAAFAVSSGKAALAIVLSALHAQSRRRKVILPAYTCFSVPSAIVRAGLEPVPCDIAPGRFDYDYDRVRDLLDEAVLCVLSVHLFAIPSDTRRLIELCDRKGIFVVEDAAQALGVGEDGEALGSRGHAGIYSFGRGKNVTCGGGGLIVTRDDRLAAGVDALVRALPRPDDAVITLATLLGMRSFISPSLYWLPAAMPSLRLGETIYDEAFAMTRLSKYRTSLLADWADSIRRLGAVRRSHARYYVRHIPGVCDFGDVPYLRFPVVVEAAERERVLREGSVLGISGMYPTAVGRIRQLRDRFAMSPHPQADRVAEELVTLPTHPLLSAHDRESICALVAGALANRTAGGGARVELRL